MERPPSQQKESGSRGLDLLSRGAPVYGEWTLHSEIVEQIWARLGRATVDLFASRNNAQLLSAQHGCSPRGRRTSARLATRASVRFPATGLDTPYSVQSEAARPRTDFDSAALAGGDISVAVRSALAAPATQGPAVAGGRDGLSPVSRAPGAVGLAPEWLNLSAVGLSQRVISYTKCSSLLH